MSNLTPFEYANYSNPPKDMVGCFLNDSNLRSNSNIDNYSIYAFSGLIYGFVLFLFNIFFSELYGKHKDSIIIIQIATLIIFTWVIYLCLKSYRDKNGYIDWKTGVIVGCIIGVTYSLTSSSLIYIYFNFINPAAFDNYLNNIFQSIDSETIESSKEFYIASQLISLLMSIPSGLFFGALLSLIPTKLLKSK